VTGLGRLVVRRPRRVLGVWAVLAVVFGIIGSGLQDRLANRGYEVPGSPSDQAQQRARSFFGADTTRVFVALTSASADHARVRAASADVTPRMRGLDDLVAVEPPTIGRDGRAAVVPVALRVDAAEAQHRVADVRDRLGGIGGGSIDSGVIGQAAVFNSYSTIAREDLAKAERFAFPITLAVLLVAFLSVIAAGLPVLLAGVTLVMTFGLLYVLTLVTDMSVFATNTAVLLGVGLSIDYSLFVVTRYREELRRGRSVDDAIVEAQRTSGRTVAASALTVAAALTCLLVVGVGIFSSMTYGASGAAILAGLCAITLLPAVLKLLGPRVDRFSLRPVVRAADSARLWSRVGDMVIRRRLPVIAVIVVVLVAMSIPVSGLQLDARATSVLPASSHVRQLSDRVALSLGETAGSPVEVYTDAPPGPVRQAIASTPGVREVSTPARGRDGGSRLIAGLTDPSDSAAAETTVERLREALPRGTTVGGETAQALDLKSRIDARTPWVVLAAVVLGFALLLVSIRSIVVPIKAVITTLLSVGAALGMIVLGYSVLADTDTIASFVPLLLFAVVFGLSIDYEIFLLSRVREEYEGGRGNDDAVRAGLVRSARPITLAATVMMSVFLASAASSLVPLRQLGLGLALAVLIDATVVRALLVPAALSLIGDRNWWFPVRSPGRPRPET